MQGTHQVFERRARNCLALAGPAAGAPPQERLLDASAPQREAARLALQQVDLHTQAGGQVDNCPHAHQPMHSTPRS